MCLKVSANTILKGLVKNVDAAIISEVEVVAVKYDIDTGMLHWLLWPAIAVAAHATLCLIVMLADTMQVFCEC